MSPGPGDLNDVGGHEQQEMSPARNEHIPMAASRFVPEQVRSAAIIPSFFLQLHWYIMNICHCVRAQHINSIHLRIAK